MPILTLHNKKEEKFLRRKVRVFDFADYSKKELRKIIQDMRRAMKAADGIGLSANQFGIDTNFFIAEVERKFYAIFNPSIEKKSEEKEIGEEGCLSVPRVFGGVERPLKITLTGYDINQKKLRIKTWGLLARVFQHEMDHLNGTLFIDKATNIHETPKE